MLIAVNCDLMTSTYSLNAGQYVLMNGSTPVGRVLDEVSIALDKIDGTLHKHGSPESVLRWHTATQKKLRAAGANEWADNLVVLTGRFPLEELNACLTHSGNAGRLYQKALTGELERLPLGEVQPSVQTPGLRRAPVRP